MTRFFEYQYSQLGQTLNRFRKLNGLTQLKLSQIAKMRQGTVSKVESGVDKTTIKAIYDICIALNLEIIIRPILKNRLKNKNLTFDPTEVFK